MTVNWKWNSPAALAMQQAAILSPPGGGGGTYTPQKHAASSEEVRYNLRQQERDREEQSRNDQSWSQGFWQTEAKNKLELQAAANSEARKNQLMSLLAGQFAGDGSAKGGVNYGEVAGLLGNARDLRAATFSPGSLGGIDPHYGEAELGYTKSRLGDLSTANSLSQRALQDQGQAQIQNQYLSSLRDMRSLSSDRALPTETATAMKSDLLRQRIRSGKDLQQGLIINESDRQQQVLGLLANITAADQASRLAREQFNSGLEYQERINRLGNPELAAQYNLESQQANQQLASARLQALLSALGSM